MVKLTWFHPSDKVSITGSRYGSKPAELFLHLSESDIRRLTNFGQSGQVKLSSHGGGSLIFKGRFRIISTGKKKKKSSMKPKSVPPIPSVSYGRTSLARAFAGTKTKSKSKKKRKPSEYNLFVKKHRLAGKSMEQIGVMWRKKK